MGLNWLDWALLAALAAGAWIGFSRGFLGLLSGIVASLIGAWVAGRYSATVLTWVDNQYHVSSKMAGAIIRQIHLPAEANQVPASSLPFEKIVELLNKLPLPDAYKADLATHVQAWSSSAHGNETVADFIGRSIASGILSAFAFVIIATLVAWVLARVLGALASRFNDTPLLGGANRIVGGVAGFAEAALMITVLLGILMPLTALPLLTKLAPALQESVLAPKALALFKGISHWIFGRVDGFFFTNGNQAL